MGTLCYQYGSFCGLDGLQILGTSQSLSHVFCALGSRLCICCSLSSLCSSLYLCWVMYSNVIVVPLRNSCGQCCHVFSPDYYTFLMENINQWCDLLSYVFTAPQQSWQVTFTSSGCYRKYLEYPENQERFNKG